MELTSHLKLLQWILTHTYILSGNDTRQPISNQEIKNIFFKVFPETRQDLNNEINLLIGNFLKYSYGNQLIKIGSNPIKYNIGIVKAPIKEIFIQDYKGVYDFNYYSHYNKSNFADVKNTYKTINKIFKGVSNDKEINKPLKQQDFIKLDNLANDIILFCLNKGIPKNILKYFLFYTMSLINPRDLNLFLTRYKQDFKKNKVCAICGASENLTIHHIKEVSKAPYLEFNKNNFIVLCNECHIKHHQKQDQHQSNKQRQQANKLKGGNQCNK